MSDRFRLLVGSSRRQDRQATLRATLDWSWDLLDPWEQAGLAQISVFRGGFDLEAAEAVLDLEAWPDAPWAMDVVQALVDKSLVRALDDRFDTWVTVHEYASDRLVELGGEQEAWRRHAEHYGELGTSQARRDRMGSDSHDHLDRLLRDRSNVQAGIDRMIEMGESGVAIPLAIAAGDVAIHTGHSAALAAWMSRLEAMPTLREIDLVHLGRIDLVAHALERPLRQQRDLAADLLDRARRLRADDLILELANYLAFVMVHSGEFDDGEVLAAEASKEARRTGDMRMLARAERTLANAATRRADPKGARIILERLIEQQEEADYPRGSTVSELARVVFDTGQAEEGAALYDLALGLIHEENQSLALTLSQAAGIWACVGRFDDALEALERSAAIYASVGRREGEAGVHRGLAFVLGLRDGAHHPGVIDALQRAVAIYESLGVQMPLAQTLSQLAGVLRQRGELAQARAAVERAVVLLEEYGAIQRWHDAREELAHIQLLEGDEDGALATATALAQHTEATGNFYRGVSVSHFLVDILLRRGEAERALAVAQRAFDLVEEHGVEGQRHVAHIRLGHALTAAEQFEDAARILSAAADAGRALERAGAVGTALGELGISLAEAGETKRAEEALTESMVHLDEAAPALRAHYALRLAVLHDDIEVARASIAVIREERGIAVELGVEDMVLVAEMERALGGMAAAAQLLDRAVEALDRTNVSPRAVLRDRIAALRKRIAYQDSTAPMS
jgi:predicted ATPase